MGQGCGMGGLGMRAHGMGTTWDRMGGHGTGTCGDGMWGYEDGRCGQRDMGWDGWTQSRRCGNGMVGHGMWEGMGAHGTGEVGTWGQHGGT